MADSDQLREPMEGSPAWANALTWAFAVAVLSVGAWQVAAVSGGAGAGASGGATADGEVAGATTTLFWRLAWLGGFVLAAVTPWRPIAGVIAFILVAYGTPRYTPAYDALMASPILHYLAGAALVGWVVSLCRARRGPAPMGPLLWCLVALLLWLFISAVAAHLRGTPWRPHPNHHPSRFFHAFVLFVLGGQLLLRRSSATWLIMTLIAVLLWRVGESAVMRDGDIFRHRDADVAALAVMTAPLALFLAATFRPPPLRVLFLSLGVGLLAVALLTRNRGAAVAVLVTLPLMWLLCRCKLRALLIGASIFALALAVELAVVLAFGTGYTKKFTETIAGEGALNSVNERLIMWQAAGRMARAHPLTGVGAGNYHNEIERYAPADPWQIGEGITRPDIDNEAAHNSTINVLGEAGFPAALFYGALFVGALSAVCRVRTRLQGAVPSAAMPLDAEPPPCDWRLPAADALIAALLAYLVVGLFISRHDMALAYLLAGWTAALGVSRRHRSADAAIEQRSV